MLPDLRLYMHLNRLHSPRALKVGNIHLNICVQFALTFTSMSKRSANQEESQMTTPNLPTNIVDFRGFDSSTILILRGGILRPIGIS